MHGCDCVSTYQHRVGLADKRLNFFRSYSFYAASGFFRRWPMNMEWAPPGDASPPHGSFLSILSVTQGYSLPSGMGRKLLWMEILKGCYINSECLSDGYMLWISMPSNHNESSWSFSPPCRKASKPVFSIIVMCCDVMSVSCVSLEKALQNLWLELRIKIMLRLDVIILLRTNLFTDRKWYPKDL